MWPLVTTYGMRWKVEALFFSIKQIFGENSAGDAPGGKLREVRIKLNCYTMLVTMVTGRGTRGWDNATQQIQRSL
jgi:hypothetical protein